MNNVYFQNKIVRIKINQFLLEKRVFERLLRGLWRAYDEYDEPIPVKWRLYEVPLRERLRQIEKKVKKVEKKVDYAS